MVFSPDLNPEDGGFRRRRGHRQRPKTGFSSKNGKGFTEDIWNFDDSWFTATQCRGRLDVFGELLWELVRLQSLLDYLLGGDMTPSDDRHRSSRRRDASDPRRPRARSTHGPPRPESYGADADFVSGLLLSRQTKNRRRDASVPRVSSKDCDDSSRASASGEEHGNKEEKGWRTLTRELRKLLSSKFSDKDTDCGDEDSQSADSSPSCFTAGYFVMITLTIQIQLDSKENLMKSTSRFSNADIECRRVGVVVVIRRSRGVHSNAIPIDPANAMCLMRTRDIKICLLEFYSRRSFQRQKSIPNGDSIPPKNALRRRGNAASPATRS
ncbi:unnamed protein product [Notodromas monacha]|uniref:Uncharacterized protein n=1 Tax=Notodromas monacha TaxID=399045 RepID=A0A7R9BWK0_9CRUS|nr:unnamed protein product [Notodromas monacha]CAG0923115.1 unnamed protein product [Notodromas monacha]